MWSAETRRLRACRKSWAFTGREKPYGGCQAAFAAEGAWYLRGGEKGLGYTFGEMVLRVMGEEGIRRDELYRGLCSMGTFTRYMSGKFYLDRLLMTAFLQRMGKSPDKSCSILRCSGGTGRKWSVSSGRRVPRCPVTKGCRGSFRLCCRLLYRRSYTAAGRKAFVFWRKRYP